MAKRVPRAHRHRREPSRTPAINQDPQPEANTPLRRVDRGSDRLLDRLLTAPHLARVVPRLQPEVLHRVIQHCGLEDCGELVALATPGQLARVFDLDVWRPAAPGLDEQFDADRFGTWLDVMVDAGMSGAAATLAGMDVDLVAGGFAQHVRVFDSAAVAPYMTLDGEEARPGYFLDNRVRCEVGGFTVVQARPAFWEVITAVLAALADAHGTRFGQIMRACCRLSNSLPEVDGLDDLLTTGDQAMFDLALDRDVRRDSQGYVTPAHARAFLQTSRRIDIRQAAQLPPDAMTREYFRNLDEQAAVGRDDESSESAPRDGQEPTPDVPEEAAAAIVDLLQEAGVMPRAPRALLDNAQTSVPRLARILGHLQVAHDREPAAHAMRNAELAYLANVIVAGSTIQARALTAEEGTKAAVAVCNLGLERWPAHLPEDFLIHHDLVRVFQVGWTVLHEDVCLSAAEQLLSILMSLNCTDSHLQDALETLRLRLTRHWRAGSPWDAREALEVIAMLDTPSWAALRSLLDQFPTMHAAVGASLTGAARQIDASAFEFISENAQLEQIHEFMQRLPRLLHG